MVFALCIALGRYRQLQAASSAPLRPLLSRHEGVEDGLDALDAVVQGLSHVGTEVVFICTQH